MNRSFLLLLAVASSCHAQIIPRDEPRPLWSASIPPAGHGNECAMYGTDALLICTGIEGSVVAINPSADPDAGGTQEWSHNPTSLTNTQTYSSSGVVFGFNPTIGNYIIHAVSEGFKTLDPSYCVIYALNPEKGEVMWVSQALEGACSGTPVISEDGNYVFLTHNLVSIGHFTVLAASLNGVVFFSQLDPIQPYGPPGIFFNPLEGYYPGGTANRNDVLIWAYRPTPSEEGVGNGQTFAFQFPIGFMNEAIDLGVTPLTNVTWQTTTAPQLFNRGYSMFYGVSRSQFRVWNGAFGDTANRFDKKPTNAVDFARGDPKWQSVRANLELSSDPLQPMAFGGAANPVFAGFDYLLNEMWTVSTTFPIFAEARISPDDATVYCVEQNGKVHSVDVQSGKVRWSASLGGVPVTADFAQSKNGKYLYFNNQVGILQAWQVADAPSPVPTSTPSMAPSIPTEQPSRDPISPTIFPTVFPSEGIPLASAYPSLRPSVLPTPTAADPTDATSVPSPVPSPSPVTPSIPSPTPEPTTLAPVEQPPTSGAGYRQLTCTIMMISVAAWFL